MVLNQVGILMYIPELTQEQFIDFHKKYYHPSNSYIFLYGDLDIEEKLKFIDEEYLKNFEKIQVDLEIATQTPFKIREKGIIEYSISTYENEEDKTFISMNFAVGKAY